uniref:Uncharacterized protein n=1 Tax=Oryza brachyantha TaxID=4533 RepID=J3MNQ7_ORYBR
STCKQAKLRFFTKSLIIIGCVAMKTEANFDWKFGLDAHIGCVSLVFQKNFVHSIGSIDLCL